MMLSYHVIMDTITQDELNLLLEHLKRYKPPYINIMGGSKFLQAQALVEWLFHEIPETTVILRKWPDDGLIKKYNYDMIKWYDDIIKPYEDWLQTYQSIWLLDNESTENDLTQYAKASAEAMDICGNKKIRLAVGRFAAGNPKEHQYQELDQMWLSLKKWKGYHIWSPNEYYDRPAVGFGGGSIQRFKYGLNRCLDHFGFTPEIVIGEFGLANNYDPYSGWRDTGLTEEEYANLCLAYYKMWYQPYGITACIFSVGYWKSFQVLQDFFLVAEKNKPNETPKPPKENQGCFDLIVRNPISQGVSSMLSAIFEVIKSVLTNQRLMTPIIGGIIAILVNNGILQVDNPDLWVERIFQVILLLTTGNILYDGSNVLRGNMWDSQLREWTKE